MARYNNIILILSNSKNNTEFNKYEFSPLNGRMLFDYLVDSCKKSKKFDHLFIVSSLENMDFLKKRYQMNVLSGSESDAEKYLSDSFKNGKIVIVSSYYPLITSSQIDEYFDFMDNYSLVKTLSEKDGVCYPFGKSFGEFNENKEYICENYLYSRKITQENKNDFYPLYEKYIVGPQEEKTLGIVNYYLSADGTKGIREWIDFAKEKIKDLSEKYELENYFINSQTEGNIVYEAVSKKYGDIIIKFTPSEKKFHKEWVYYHFAAPGIMADMIDYNLDDMYLVLKMIKPGFQVKFDKDNPKLRAFYNLVDANMIPFETTGNDEFVPTVYGEFEDYSRWAENAPFEKEFRKSMESKALKVWNAYFKDSKKYYLHRDLHKRNLLSSGDGKIVAIDPMGAMGPRAFEYVIPFIIELREYPEDLNTELYHELLDYFSKYVDREELEAAMFFFWVFKMNDYCFQKKDDFKLAGWCKKCILKIYFEDIKDPTIENVMPKGLQKVL